MKDRTTSSLFSATALAGALATASFATAALADDITIDNTKFTGSKTRDEVRAELMTPYGAGGNPWSTEYKQGVAVKNARTPLDAQREYLESRDEVAATGSEDGGSSFFNGTTGRRNPTATMGGPGR